VLLALEWHKLNEKGKTVIELKQGLNFIVGGKAYTAQELLALQRKAIILLVAILVIVLIAVVFQAMALRDARNDTARFKQVGVWAFVHGQNEFVRYVRERNNSEETLRKYLTPQAIQAIKAPQLTDNAPAIPAEPHVDGAALRDVLAIAASGRW
jgi:hypothetical protein